MNEDIKNYMYLADLSDEDYELEIMRLTQVEQIKLEKKWDFSKFQNLVDNNNFWSDIRSFTSKYVFFDALRFGADAMVVTTTSDVTDCRECNKASVKIIKKERFNSMFKFIDNKNVEVPMWKLDCECVDCNNESTRFVYGSDIMVMVDDYYSSINEIQNMIIMKEQSKWTENFVWALENDIITAEDFCSG